MDYIRKRTTKVSMACASSPHMYVEKSNLSRQIETAVLHNYNVHAELIDTQ